MIDTLSLLLSMFTATVHVHICISLLQCEQVHTYLLDYIRINLDVSSY